MADTLYLIDGSSYLYRAYFAIKRLSSPSGFPTNALYGFTQMLLRLLQEHQPTHIAVVFDVSRVTFRTELYPAYKANRSEMPEDLRVQIAPIRRMIEAFRIPVIDREGYEADDIIGTLAREWERTGGDVVVVTGDKDLMQIVSKQTTLLDTMKNTRSGIPQVLERFGVPPEQVIDILGLAGDSSDNIPGVPGIGEKTAIKLIQQFGSLDALLEQADQVPGKTGERLREFAEQARLSRQLATIICTLDYHIDQLPLVTEEPDRESLHGLFSEYGFTSLIKELTATATLSHDEYQCVTDKPTLVSLIEDIQQKGIFAFDTETTGLDPRSAGLVGISIAFRPHQAWYIPVGHRYLGAPDQLSPEEVRQLLAPVFADATIKKVGQNLKFDVQVLTSAGYQVTGCYCDTMLCSYLLSPSRGGHGLDAMAQEYFNHRMISYDEVTGTGKNRICFSQVELPLATRYAAEDADVTWMLYQELLSRIEQAGMGDLLFKLEMPLSSILTAMELHGVLLDRALLTRLSLEFGSQMQLLEADIHELAGGAFNLNSPKQLEEVLFDRLGLAATKKTKGKTGRSTDNEVLSSLAQEHEIANRILSYRSLAKLKSTYTDALLKLTDSHDRVHTSYNQAVTATGRLSSSDPNLQNIPVRTEEGRKIREAFIAPAGSCIIAADYSQIELRVLAHLSKDPVFCDAFSSDQDIHTRTAAEIFGLFPEMVSSEMRRQAKAINFGVIYGQGAFSLAKQLGIARPVAERFIATYKERHNKAMEYLDGCIEQARQSGFVTTILGRRLPIADINSSNGNLRSYAERNAINYPIQGSAADIIKQAMINVDQALRDGDFKTRLVMQVHDELVFEAPETERDQVIALIRDAMSTAVPMVIPLTVDIHHGATWSEAH